MESRYISTGQAARLCSVTRDTVLKWIYSGVLPASRTAGGHHRIARADLEKVGGRERLETGSAPEKLPYCWEFFGSRSKCTACPVYVSRALRCFELVRMLSTDPAVKLQCGEDCLNCRYSRSVHGMNRRVLLVTEDPVLIESATSTAIAIGVVLKAVNCGYSCSAALSEFLPDLVVIDREMGAETCCHLVQHLKDDPRLLGMKLLIAGETEEIRDNLVAGWIPRGFDARNLLDALKDPETYALSH